MKYFSKAVLLFILVVVLSACGGTSPANDADALATIVAGTLTAVAPGAQVAEATFTASAEPVQPSTVETTATALPAVNPPASADLTLDSFPTKELLGENDHYAAYMLNPVSSDNGKAGEIIIFDKLTNVVVPIHGPFTIFGSTIVHDDGKGEYVMLSVGTYVLRTAMVLSLAEQRQVVNDFCKSTGEVLFWNGFVLINNCDKQPNRPWGAGEASSVVAINLKTGTQTVIAQSDLTHQYALSQIDGNTVRYTESYVDNEADWQSQDKQKTNEGTYDLTLLGSN